MAASLVLASGNLTPVGLLMAGLGLVTVATVWAAAETRPEKDPNHGER